MEPLAVRPAVASRATAAGDQRIQPILPTHGPRCVGRATERAIALQARSRAGVPKPRYRRRSSTADDQRSTRCRACRPATWLGRGRPALRRCGSSASPPTGRWIDATAALDRDPTGEPSRACHLTGWTSVEPVEAVTAAGPRPPGRAAAAARTDGRGRDRYKVCWKSPGCRTAAPGWPARRRHGQGHGQGAARGGRPSPGPLPLPPRGYIGADLARTVEAVLGWPVFVEARQHGLVDRNLPGRQRRRHSKPPSIWPGATTSS